MFDSRKGPQIHKCDPITQPSDIYNLVLHGPIHSRYVEWMDAGGMRLD